MLSVLSFGLEWRTALALLRWSPMALLGALALAWPLIGHGSGVEEDLRRLDGEIQAPQDLGGGRTLLRVRAEGTVWTQVIGSDRPVVIPDDTEFRALVRARCADERLAALITAGATVMEHHYGPEGPPAFSLRMTDQVCDQVRMG